MNGISCTRQIDIQGLSAFIFDALVPPDLIDTIYQSLVERPYDSDHASSKSTKIYREWVCEMDLDAFRCDDLYGKMNELVGQCFQHTNINAFSVFCNCISFGCHTFMHQDGGKNCYSALYYANPIWEKNWGGETTLFNDQGDAVACIFPVPGRIVILDGRILHRAGMPSRSCPHRRYTVSLRCDSSIVPR